MKKISIWLVLMLLAITPATFAAETNTEAAPGLSDTVIVIIRHAEKPESGFELSPAGEKRAAAYTNYFKDLLIDSRNFTPDYLVATADSEGSHRPRLTLEPLSQARGLKIDSRFKNKKFKNLADDLRATPHGKNILIAWHHGDLPQLAQALGADADKLLPDGKWPADVFDWMVELRYDHDGRLAESKLIHEKLMPGDSK